MSTDVTPAPALYGPIKAGVLIVDDDAALRTMVTMILEDAEWDVLEAKNGREALAMLRSSPRHLVALLDWMMPEMSGMDVLEAVKADPELAARHAYVLVTANVAAFSSQLMDLLRELVVPVIAKPFEIQELLSRVEYEARRIGAKKAAS
jgi:CheY-like chemotaxis protein